MSTKTSILYELFLKLLGIGISPQSDMRVAASTNDDYMVVLSEEDSPITKKDTRVLKRVVDQAEIKGEEVSVWLDISSR